MITKVNAELDQDIRITVPGSLILMGEYFITLPKNRALCMAINRYASLDLRIRLHTKTLQKNSDTIPHIVITSDYGFKRTTWHNLEKFSMWKIARATFGEMLDNTKLEGLFEKSIHSIDACIDSSQFFTSINTHRDVADTFITKLGLGSSECSAVLVCALVLISKNLNPISHKAFLAQFASRVHYLWQDRKGSGYGVYAAIYGGLGLYTHDKEYSSWKTVSLKGGGSIHYVFGGKAHKTKGAIQLFKSFMKRDEETFIKLLKSYLKAMKDLECERNNLDYASLCIVLLKAKKIGVQLGALLDIPAECSVVSKKYGRYIEERQDKKKSSILWKSTGAGNESIVRISSVPSTLKQGSPPEMFELGLAMGIRMNTEIR